MANEAVLVNRMSDPIDFICEDSVGIEKGTLVAFSGAGSREVVATTGAGEGEVFAGIVAREKIASDGRTRIAVFVDGIFDITMANGTATVGQLMHTSGANIIEPATATDVEGGKVVGKILEPGVASTKANVLLGRCA